MAGIYGTTELTDGQLREQLASLVHEQDIGNLSIDEGLQILSHFVSANQLKKYLLRSTMTSFRLPAVQEVRTAYDLIRMIYTTFNRYACILTLSDHLSEVSARDVIESIHPYDENWIAVVLKPSEYIDSKLHRFIKRILDTFDCIEEVAYAEIPDTGKVVYTLSVFKQYNWDVSQLDIRNIPMNITTLIDFETPTFFAESEYEEFEDSEPEDINHGLHSSHNSEADPDSDPEEDFSGYFVDNVAELLVPEALANADKLLDKITESKPSSRPAFKKTRPSVRDR